MSNFDGRVMSVRDAQECALKVLEMHLESAWKTCFPNEPAPTAKTLYHPIGSETQIGRLHATKVLEPKEKGNCSVLCWRSFVRDWQKIADAAVEDCKELAMGAHKKTKTKRVRTRNTNGY